MCVQLLFLLRVRHAGLGLVLVLRRGVELPVRDLLVLLDEGAAAAAARDGEIGQAVALEVELVADVGALHRRGDAGDTDAAGSAEEEALCKRGRLAGNLGETRRGEGGNEPRC